MNIFIGNAILFPALDAFLMSVIGCYHGEVRLAGGMNSSEGHVEICLNDEWGTVCDQNWDQTDAGVVCRQLGFQINGIYV